jgi:NAD(P)-dependent dehydrogenase (short-subunit alcohol dehydrogenase family)
MPSLAGAEVCVVGGSSGIGLALAHAAHAAGAVVVVASRKPERVRAELPEARLVTLDVTDGAAVEAAFATLGPLDHLVCTAADGFPRGILESSVEEATALMDTKFWGQYRCARAAAPLIRPGGSITLTSGIRSRRPLPGSAAFTATNMAVEGLTRALALELAPTRVNAVAPGTVDTPVFGGMPEEKRRRMFDALAERLPAGRIGSPDDIAAAYMSVMLNGFTTGSVVDVDGGALLV